LERRKRLIKENSNKETYKQNWALKRKDDTTFIAEVNTVKLPKPFQHLQLNIVRDISDFTKQQNLLIQNEQNYRAYFKNNFFSIINVGLDGTFLNVNEAFLKLVGYTKKELAHKRPRDLTHPNDTSISQQKLKILREKKVSSYTIDKRYINKKGDVIYVKIYVTGIYNKNKLLTSYFATILDRTQEIQQRKILEEKIRRYQSEFNSNLFSKIILSPQFKVIKFNNKASKFLGIPTENLLQLKLKKLIHPEDYLLFTKQLKEIINKKKTQFLIDEIRFFHSEKHVTTGLVFVIGVFSVLNELDAFYINIHDITKQSHTIKRLIESENKYKNYINNSFLAAFSIDLKGQFLETNQAFYKIFGYSKNELSSLKITNILHLNNTLLPSNKITLMQKKKIKSIALEKNFIKKNGEILYAKTYVSCIYNLKNELNSFHIMLVDITAEIKAKEKLESTLAQSDIIFKNNLVGELIYLHNGNLLKANRKVCNFLGYSFKELKTIYVKDVIPPSEYKPLRRQIDLLTDGKINHFSITQKFLRKNGSDAFGKILITAIKNRKGNNESYHVLILDFTAEVIASRHLIENESKFKGIFNNAPYGIILYDITRETVIDCNKTALKFSGCKSVKEFSH